MTYSTEVANYITESYRSAATTAIWGYLHTDVASAKALMASMRNGTPDFDFDSIDAEVDAAYVAKRFASAAAESHARQSYTLEQRWLAKRDALYGPRVRKAW